MVEHFVDLSRVKKLLQEAPNCQNECATFLGDLDKFMTVLEATSNPEEAMTKPKELKAALAYIETTPHPKVLKDELWNGNACSKGLVSAASALLQVC